MLYLLKLPDMPFTKPYPYSTPQGEPSTGLYKPKRHRHHRINLTNPNSAKPPALSYPSPPQKNTLHSFPLIEKQRNIFQCGNHGPSFPEPFPTIMSSLVQQFSKPQSLRHFRIMNRIPDHQRLLRNHTARIQHTAAPFHLSCCIDIIGTAQTRKIFGYTKILDIFFSKSSRNADNIYCFIPICCKTANVCLTPGFSVSPNANSS